MNTVTRVFIAFCLLSAAAGVAAIGVDVREVSAADQTMEFISYTGLSLIVESDAEIRGIGAELANLARQGRSPARFADKYTAIHVPLAGTSDAFGADIIGIEPAATVDPYRQRETGSFRDTSKPSMDIRAGIQICSPDSSRTTMRCTGGRWTSSPRVTRKAPWRSSIPRKRVSP